SHGAIDWNCDGLYSPGVSSDIDDDGSFGSLPGAGDWDSLDFRFQCQPTFADGVDHPDHVTAQELTLAQANAGGLRARIVCQSNAACDDGNFCNGVETCSPATGFCQPGTPPSCADANPCTVDTCSTAANGCVHDAAAANGSACALPNAAGSCAD